MSGPQQEQGCENKVQAQDLVNEIVESIYIATFGGASYEETAEGDFLESNVGFDICEEESWDEFPENSWPFEFHHWEIDGIHRHQKTKRKHNLRKFCKNITDKNELKSQVKKTKISNRAYFAACKKELRRKANEAENAENKKKNIELKLKQKNTPRKWPEGMPPYRDIHVKYIPCKKRDNHSGKIYNDEHFVLRRDNADKLGDALISQLMTLQDREITPNDFDLLLQLDNFVEVKTVPKHIIDGLQCVTVNEGIDDVCLICMEEYAVGDSMKYLPCRHNFHSACIRTWLTYTSCKCPLDGLEVC
ncbi:uncharacterized protein LOC5516273 [Nematostella vectensis]|uniref:uncharacterized protein LOC5516273 n=1 Tax=Nematostella vectensis TaxID=45351 RepID=UPI002076FB72|nr:uncharacterized protein LOC5516273 [Nematostella vectensis]